MNTLTHTLPLSFRSSQTGSRSLEAARQFPGISPRVRASLVLRRLTLENAHAHARAESARPRNSHDLRHAA